MSYTSMIYLLLVGAAFILYYVVPLKYRWYVLLAANIVFYLKAGVDELILMLLTALAAFLAGRRVGALCEEAKQLKKDKERKAERLEKTARMYKIRTIGVIIVLTVLAIVKYTNFACRIGARIIGQTPASFSFIVPMGISFYSFAMVAYLNDVAKGKVKCQTNFLKFFLFVSFFPTVVEGPISRYAQLGPQLEEGHRFRFENLRDGAILILWGFAKKLVIAESLNTFTSAIYDSWQDYSGVIFLAAAMVYSIQIYADFDGCMNVASGTARLFGIELTPNFLRPYFARTLPEFWRRWHVTMGAFFRDYVFFPFSISKFSTTLNRSARKKLGDKAGRIISAALPIMVVWILTGIWHGAESKYIVWGLFHGILIMLGTICEPAIRAFTVKSGIRTECFSFRLFQMLRTFLLCSIGRIFFRANSVGSAFCMIRSFIHPGLLSLRPQNLLELSGMSMLNVLVILVLLAAWLVVSCLEEKGVDVLAVFSEQNLIFRWILLYALLLIVVLAGHYGSGYDAAAFIYEKF